MNVNEQYSEALALYEDGFSRKSSRILKEILNTDPDHGLSLYLLGKIAFSKGFFDEAREKFALAIEKDPNQAEWYRGLAETFLKLKDFASAAFYFREYGKKVPPSAEIYFKLGSCHLENQEPGLAAEAFREVVALDQAYTEAYYRLGICLRILGEKDEAVNCFQKAIALDSRHAGAYYYNAITNNFSSGDKGIAEMEEMLNSSETSQESRVRLAFGLGKIHEKLKNFDRSFLYYKIGNDTQKTLVKHDRIIAIRRFYNFISEKLDKRFFQERCNSGCTERRPIFIVGMPRSGTSLVEQILASHPLVFGAGELMLLRQVILQPKPQSGYTSYPYDLEGAEPDIFQEFGRDYLSGIKLLNRENRQYVTDKMPQNFLDVGMIRLILPESIVIHCCRNPIATCFSCFTSYFGNNLPFSYDLEELSEYFSYYRKIMTHWHSVLPGFVLDFSYEELLANPEKQVKALLDFCGLAWDDRCLDFHRHSRAVLTASATEVRQPLYTSSISRWENYSDHLEPLISRLSAIQADSRINKGKS